MARLLYVGLLVLGISIFPLSAEFPKVSCLPAGFKWDGRWLRKLGEFDADLNRYWQDVYVADVSSVYERRCNGTEE